MELQGIQMAWIVVDDLSKALHFYQNMLGFTLLEHSEEFGWAELSAGNAMRLGVAQKNDADPMKPGQNAVVTVTVPDLAQAIDEISRKGVRLVGAVVEVPGHVKMQLLKDLDGNMLQLVQMIE